jgi:sarcosine oxidase subunit beta
MLLGISNTDEEPGFCREFSYGWTTAFDQAAEIIAPPLSHIFR